MEQNVVRLGNLKRKTKSPLLENPLRVPGQSLEEEIQRVIQRQVVERLLVIGMLFMSASYEWVKWILGTPPSPFLLTFLCIVAIAFVTPGLVRTRERLRRMRLGRDGERAVGQTLERLATRGFHVFHDLVGSNGNIDHVLVGSRGIFAIDTKTLSKPSKGQAVVTYDSSGLRIAGRDLGDYLIQARAEAASVRKIMLDELRMDFPVRPVVVLPGWYVKADGTQPKDVWVLEPKAFLKWVARQPESLQPEDVQRIRRIISKHIRNSYNAAREQV